MSDANQFLTVAEMRANRAQARALDNTKHGKGESRRFDGTTRPAFVYELIPNKDAVILECGPIAGALTKELLNHGYKNIHTADFIDVLDAVNRAALQSISEVDFNRDTLPYPDNTFDAALCFGLAEHFENPFHFAREAARVMKPGGVLIWAVPNVLHIFSRLVFLFQGMFPRFNYTNNHISILPRGIFDKTILRDFILKETRYYEPTLRWRGLKMSHLLPSNEWFGDHVAYFLIKK